ncbi:MAG: HAMP domain-containing sensor histidine kinase [Actinomycetota bacterium]
MNLKLAKGASDNKADMSSPAAHEAPGGLRFANLPIRAKLLLPFVGLMVIWGSFTTYVLARSAEQESRSSASAQLSQALDAARASFQRDEEQLLSDARVPALTEGVAQAIIDHHPDVLENALRPTLILGQGKNYQSISVIDRTGAILKAIENVNGNLHTATGGTTRSATLIAVAQGHTPFTGIVDSSLVAEVPISLNNSTVGAVILTESLDTIVSQISAQQHAHVSVQSNHVKLAGDDLPFLADNTRTKAGKIEILSAPLLVGGAEVATIVIGLPAHASGWTASALAILVAAVVALVLGMGVKAARSVSEPITKLVDTARSLGSGDLSKRAEIAGRDEVGRLSAAFNQMASELQASHEELERKVEQRTAELARANSELERVSKAKSDFLAAMSHELRTPLHTVIGFSEMLADPKFKLGDQKERRTYAENILTSGKHLLGLIEELLDLAKIEAGKIVIDPQPVAIQDVIAQVRTTMEPAAKAKSISISLETPKRIPNVIADRGRVVQILLNLVSNAIKYTQAGGAIRIELRADDPYLCIAVADNGPGLTEEECAHVFEPFERGNAAQGPVEGVGLGLALARQLVELHGGRIWVSSTPSEGSTFSFTLPLESAIASVEAQAS